MATVPPGATIRVVRVDGDAAEIGAAVGRALRAQIQRSVGDALARLWHEHRLDEAGVAERMMPALDVAERWTPTLVAELRARATAADVPFAVLAYLSADGLPPHAEGRHGCTSMPVRSMNGGVVLGHTEDTLVPNPDKLPSRIHQRRQVPHARSRGCAGHVACFSGIVCAKFDIRLFVPRSLYSSRPRQPTPIRSMTLASCGAAGRS